MNRTNTMIYIRNDSFTLVDKDKLKKYDTSDKDGYTRISAQSDISITELISIFNDSYCIFKQNNDANSFKIEAHDGKLICEASTLFGFRASGKFENSNLKERYDELKKEHGKLTSRFMKIPEYFNQIYDNYNLIIEQTIEEVDEPLTLHI